MIFGGTMVKGNIYLFVALLGLSILTTACVNKENSPKTIEEVTQIGSDEATDSSNSTETKASSKEEVVTEDSSDVVDSPGANDEQAVYNYMINAYQVITNNGEDYDPELHDPIVANLASMQFGITEEHAQESCIQFETFMSDATP
jgi:hypothetical protein